jgi:beta-glucanase (GH16 family)
MKFRNNGLLMKGCAFACVILAAVNAGAQQMKYKSSSIKIVPASFSRKIISLEIITSGKSKPLSLIKLNFSQKSKENIASVKVYFSAQKDSFAKAVLIDSFSSGASKYLLSVPQILIEGSNHFWIVSNKLLQVKSFDLGEQVYQQVWADEFNADTINTNNWSFEKGFVRNHEAQWYTEENATCSNGILTIEAKRIHEKNPNYQQGNNDWKRNREFIEYTASSMQTRGKQMWQYGRFELRARIDTAIGYWPAWWTLGINKQWPSNGEIDMMEYYRGSVLANMAVGTNRPYSALWYSKTVPVKSFDPNWKDQFHIWRMDWDENGIGLYLDNVLLNYQPQGNLFNRDGSGFYPFKQQHYMLLNLAIGGDNGGDPSATTFPLKYEVDYVRVSQRQEGRFRSISTHKPDKLIEQ